MELSKMALCVAMDKAFQGLDDKPGEKRQDDKAYAALAFWKVQHGDYADAESLLRRLDDWSSLLRELIIELETYLTSGDKADD